MKMEVPQVDLPLEVLAWTKVTEDILNIYKQSCRLQACIFAVCTEGTMKVSINLLEYEVHPNLSLIHIWFIKLGGQGYQAGSSTTSRSILFPFFD